MTNQVEVKPPLKIESLRPGVVVRVRSAAEVSEIIENALLMGGGEVTEAQKLLARAAFSIYGRTWGDSLFINGEEDVTVERIWIALLSASHNDEEYWVNNLVNRTAREIMRRPYDLPLYLIMIKDLGGEAGVAAFRREIATEAGISMTPLEDRGFTDLYRCVVGKSFWEMEKDNLFTFFFASYTTWQRGMEAFESMPEDAQEGVSQALTEARKNLVQLARVLLGRGLISEGRAVGNKSGSIVYSDVLQFLN